MRTNALALSAIALGITLTACGAPDAPASAPAQAPAAAPAFVTPMPPQPYTGGVQPPGNEVPLVGDATNPLSPTLGMTDTVPSGAGLTAGDAITDTSSPARAPGAIAGTKWRWMGTMIRSGQPVTPNDPAAYTLAFGADGTVKVVADCNVGAAPYTAGDPSMSIDTSSLPKASCAAGSSSAAFIDDLAAVNSMVTVKAGTLMLTFSRPDGTFGGMRFEPAAGP